MKNFNIYNPYDDFKDSFNKNQIELLKALFRKEILYDVIESNLIRHYHPPSVQILISQYHARLHDNGIHIYKYLNFSQLSKILKLSPEEIEFLTNDFLEYQKYLFRKYNEYFAFITLSAISKFKVAIDLNGIEFIIGMYWYVLENIDSKKQLDNFMKIL